MTLAFGTQSATSFRLALQTLPQRLGPSLIIVLSMACVVIILISVQALQAGFAQAVYKGASPDRAIVVGKGSAHANMLWVATVNRADALTIMDTPGIKRDAEGAPVAVETLLSYTPVEKKRDGFNTSTSLLGVGPQGDKVWPERTLVSGRMYAAGKREIIVGQRAQAEFVGLNEGDTVALPGSEWTVVGTFAANGSNLESFMMTDADTLMSALRKPAYNYITVVLENPADLGRLTDALTTNPALNVETVSELALAEETTRGLTNFLGMVSVILGSLMSAGAIFGALNTMYSAVADRRREIGTLRALGFAPVPIMVSVVLEALILALLGALLGTLSSWMLFDGTTRLIGGSVIAMAVTSRAVLMALAVACAVALLGGLFPALRAARMPIVEALRAT